MFHHLLPFASGGPPDAAHLALGRTTRSKSFVMSIRTCRLRLDIATLQRAERPYDGGHDLLHPARTAVRDVGVREPDVVAALTRTVVPNSVRTELQNMQTTVSSGIANLAS
jgi:hypothetical protein